jgi:hypothetical protein
MQITYDKQADAMKIRFNNQRTAGAIPVAEYDSVYLLMSEDNTLVGIEILALSTIADNIDSIIEQYDISDAPAPKGGGF